MACLDAFSKFSSDEETTGLPEGDESRQSCKVGYRAWPGDYKRIDQIEVENFLLNSVYV